MSNFRNQKITNPLATNHRKIKQSKKPKWKRKFIYFLSAKLKRKLNFSQTNPLQQTPEKSNNFNNKENPKWKRNI